MSSVNPNTPGTQQYVLPPLLPVHVSGPSTPAVYGGSPPASTPDEQPLGIAGNFESILASTTAPPTRPPSSVGGGASGAAQDCDDSAHSDHGSSSGSGQSGSTTGTHASQATTSGGGPQRINDGRKPFDVDASGARFSFGAQHASHESPNVSWGDGWKQVATSNGTTYMRHSSGARATTSQQVKLVVDRPGDVAIVSTIFGKGKKFPDGTILIPGLGKQATPYRIDSHGKMYPLPFGQHTFGGVRVNVLNTSVVHMVGADGVARRYESRGMMRYPRKANGAAALGVRGGGPMSNIKPEQLTALVNNISSITSSILSQAEGIKGVDSGMLAGIRSLLSGLPAALQGAIAGMTHTDGGGGTAKPFTITRAEDLFSSQSTVAIRKPRPGESMNSYVEAVYAAYRGTHSSSSSGGSTATGSRPASGAQPPSASQPPSSTEHHHSS